MHIKMKNTIDDKLIEELLSSYKNPADLLGPTGLLSELKRRLIDKVLDSELTTHLGYEKNQKATKEEKAARGENARNGHSEKTLRSDAGKITVKVPRDRHGEFEPTFVPKHQRHFDGFDDIIVSLYSRGLSTREIQEHIREMYQVEISPTFVSNATDAVSKELAAWQNRSLDSVYPIVYFDAIMVKIRHEGKVSNRAIYLALAVNMEGHKEVLGMWSSQNEGAKFWLGVITELKNRGVSDIFICCVDGLKGFGEAIETVYPKTKVQLCIVHMVRNSLKFVGWKARKEVARELKTIYNAPTAEAARSQLDAFRERYDKRYPAIGRSWEAHWERVIPFFDYPEDIRKVIYTTNAIESLNSSFRKISRSRNLFPSTDSLYKLFYLALENISRKWTMPISNWAGALNHFAIEYGERMPKNQN